MPGDFTKYATLVNLYVALGEKDKALTSATNAAQLNPALMMEMRVVQRWLR